MKKTKILLVGALLLGVPSVALSLSTQQETPTVVRAAEKTICELTFPDDNKANNKVTAYSKTWGAKSGNYNFSIAKANNNNWNWNYIRFGSKSSTSVGSIATTDAIENVSVISLTIDAINTDYVNSIKLEKSSDANFKTITNTYNLSDLTAKEHKFTINDTSASYYKFTFDCKKGSSNGFLQISKVGFYNVSVDESKYSVTFDSDGGTTIDSIDVSNDGQTKVEEPVSPTKDGFEFDGWYYEGSRWDFDNPVKSNMTLVAHWKNLQLTSLDKIVTDSISKYYRTKAKLTAVTGTSNAYVQLGNCAVEVYKRGGLPTEFNKNNLGKTFEFTSSYNPDHKSLGYTFCGDIIVSDEVVEINNITDLNDVSLDSNINRFVSIKNIKISSKFSSSKTASITNSDIVLAYYNQDYITGNVKTADVTNGSILNVEGIIDKDAKTNVYKIVVTKIDKGSTYTITYKTLGGTSVASQTVGEGERFTKPTNPTKTSTEYEEYQFGGWYLDENCSDGKEFNFDNDVTGNIIVYAKWNVIKKSVSTKFTSVKTQANLGFDYTETITREEDALASTFIPNKVEAPFSANGYSFSNGLGVLSSTTSYIEFEVENELIDTTEINFSGRTNSNGKIKFVSYDKNRQVIETSAEYTLTNEYQHIICKLTKYENVKYIRLEVSELSENDKVSISAYQVDTYFTKATTSYTDFRNITMQFRYEFDTSKFDDISSIGIALTKDTEFNFEQQGLESLPENIKLYETKKDNGTDYNTSLTIGVKNIPITAYDTSLVAVAYVKTTEGKYYFAEKSTYSVNDMVLTYLETLDKTTEMYKVLDAFATTL